MPHPCWPCFELKPSGILLKLMCIDLVMIVLLVLPEVA